MGRELTRVNGTGRAAAGPVEAMLLGLVLGRCGQEAMFIKVRHAPRSEEVVGFVRLIQ